jgi:hypothetical protein
MDKERTEGLKHKYYIERTDGSSQTGGKHEQCPYYVLDLKHDKFSEAALRAYAEACEEEFPSLAEDIRNKIIGAYYE